jgi:hypothetical protein
MTAENKTVNYTAEQTEKMVADYKAGISVEAIATELGRNVRSVIAKLAKEQVYVSKTREAGKRVMLKSEMVSEIAKLVGKSEEVMESLEKATGVALMAVLTALRAAKTE